jgi:hypothetical protein
MQHWSGSIDLIAGQAVIAAVRVTASGQGVVRLALDRPACQLDYAVSAAGIESLSQYDDCIQSVEVVSLAPDADGYLLRVTVAAEDGLVCADWSVVSGDAGFEQHSLTAV